VKALDHRSIATLLILLISFTVGGISRAAVTRELLGCAAGKTGLLSGGSRFVLVAVDLPASDELIKSALASDTRGLETMVTQGRAFIVSSGTRVLVIDRDCAGMMYTYSRTRVRILSGPFEDASGWVPSEFVSRGGR
jgi:hypothetical protein